MRYQENDICTTRNFGGNQNTCSSVEVIPVNNESQQEEDKQLITYEELDNIASNWSRVATQACEDIPVSVDEDVETILNLHYRYQRYIAQESFA